MARDPFGNYVVGVTPDPYTPGNSTSGGGLLHGVGPPDNSLGSNGQVYVNESNGDVYSKSGDVWTIVTGAGGSDNVRAGDYGGGEPNFTPSGSAGAAVDTSNDRVWWYYGGAWH